MHEDDAGKIKLPPTHFPPDERAKVLAELRAKYEAESEGDDFDAVMSRLFLATYPHFVEWLWNEAEKGLEPAAVLASVKSLSVSLLATTIDSVLPPVEHIKVGAAKLMLRQVSDSLRHRLFFQGADITIRGETRQ